MSCKKNYLLITEDEKVYIKNLYGLLTEATTGDNELVISANSTFAAGKYSQLSEKGLTELNTELENASEWLRKNKGSVIYVQVVASESQLTNYDYEQDPKVAVPPKFLSRQRAKTLTRYLKQYFKTQVEEKAINEMPIFETPKIDIGLTKYTKGQTVTTALRAQYNAEQSVAVELKLMSPEKCLIDLEIEVKYTDEAASEKFPCRGGHNCNKATFQINLNGVKIGIANLNNSPNGLSKTSGVIKINETTAKSIVSVDSKKLIFSLKCLSSNNCHSGTPEIVIKKRGEVIHNKCSPAMKRGDMTEYPLLELDPCGNVIKMGTGDATNKDTPVAKDKKEEEVVTPRAYSLQMPPNSKEDYVITSNSSDFDTKVILPAIDRGDLIKTDNEDLYASTTGCRINATIGPRGFRYFDEQGNTHIMDVDPGTRIERIVCKKPLGKNYDPYWGFLRKPYPIKSINGLGIGDSSSTDKYYVVPNPNFNKSGTDSMFEFMLSPGINPKILNDEKSKNIIRFNLDDEDIQDFEDYYVINKLVEKTPDGMYKVIANKITYAAKTYVKGTILKLDQA
jgi:hypothetical protein